MDAAIFAAQPAAPVSITVEEYLRTSYQPDRELISGELKEKPMPSRLHGYVQMLVGHWFAMHGKEWRVAPESEVRTQVRPDSFRLPDVSVTKLGTLSGKTQQNPPLIAIEILSEDDRYLELERPALDLQTMGVLHIWLLDPEQRRAWVWSGRDRWLPSKELRADNAIFLDLEWLWAEVSEHQSL